MISSPLPRLGRWAGQVLPQHDRHIVIFVHGMFADSTTFAGLVPMLAAMDTQREFDFWEFDYESRQPLIISGDQLARAIKARAFGSRRVDIVGHSMGGLVARLAVLRHNLAEVCRIVTLATPNHGAISGAQLNLLGQMTTLGLRRYQPIYARAPGVFDLTDVHTIMRAELKAMKAQDPTRLAGKSYVSIPAQYFNLLRQAGDSPPSLLMGSVNLFRGIYNFCVRMRVDLRPVHDGIVEERSNRLHPAPPGSSDEGDYMPTRADAEARTLHVTHEAGADYDHVSVTHSSEIADLLQAVLRASTLDENGIDPLLNGSPGLVRLRPVVI